MSKPMCFYDAYDRVELRLPNRPVLRCRPLTVAGAARCLRLLDHGHIEHLWVTVCRLVLPPRRQWRARRRTRKTLAQLRNLEITEVINRFLVIEDTPAPTAARADTSSTPSTPRSYDDLLAEYAARYGGPPAPSLPWPAFLACVRRADRFAARDLLRVMTGTSYGAASVMAPKGTRPALTQTLHSVERAAYG